MGQEHTYEVTVTWTGNTGTGTSSYAGYSRDHEVSVPGAATIPASSDPAFRGDPTRVNPEQLLVASLSQCHMLWYLHLAAQAGIVVTAYQDAATGTIRTEPDGSGRFEQVTLRPRVVLAAGNDQALAMDLHERVGGYCFIARSMNFPVRHRPSVLAVG